MPGRALLIRPPLRIAQDIDRASRRKISGHRSMASEGLTTCKDSARILYEGSRHKRKRIS